MFLLFIECFTRVILWNRFRASAWETQQISPTPMTVQDSSLRGFGWGWWLRCSCCGSSCTVCTWSCIWTRWIDSTTPKVRRFQCLSRSEALWNTHALLLCLRVDRGLGRTSLVLSLLYIWAFFFEDTCPADWPSLWCSVLLFSSPESLRSRLWDTFTFAKHIPCRPSTLQVPKWMHCYESMSSACAW